MQETSSLLNEIEWQERRARLFRVCGMLLLVGYVAAACWALLGWWRQWEYPYNTFFFRPWDRFMDFYYLYSKQLKPQAYVGMGGKFTSSYWPYHDFLWKLMVPRLSYTPLIIAIGTFLTFFVTTVYLQCRQKVVWQSILFCVAAVLSYPVLYAIDRSNSEILIYVFLYLFVFSYQKQRYGWAVIWLMQAIACKPFPGVFLMLFLADKRYKDIVMCCFFIAVITAASLIYLVGVDGLVPYFKQMHEGLSNYQWNYVIQNNGFRFSHSLWALYKYFVFLSCQWTGNYMALDTVYTSHKIYMPFALTIFAYVVWHVVRYETCFWKRVALLVCCMNLLPYSSGDYKLLHQFIPFFLFVNSREKNRWDIFYLVMFSLLFIPTGYWHFREFPEKEYEALKSLPECNSAILFNGLIQLSILSALLIERFYPSAPQLPVETKTN